MARTLDLRELAERIGCFGQFDPAERVCRSYCALSFVCAALTTWQLATPPEPHKPPHPWAPTT